MNDYTAVQVRADTKERLAKLRKSHGGRDSGGYNLVINQLIDVYEKSPSGHAENMTEVSTQPRKETSNV